MEKDIFVTIFVVDVQRIHTFSQGIRTEWTLINLSQIADIVYTTNHYANSNHYMIGGIAWSAAKPLNKPDS